MKRSIATLALSLCVAGCVSTAKFQAETQRAGTAESKLAAAQKQIESLQVQLKAGADQMASLQKSNKDLEESLEANKGELSKKVSGLIKEKDDLTQKLADALADKKALEAAKAEELAKVKKSYEDLTSGLKSEIAAGEVTITQLKGKLTLNMVDRILFESGQADVRVPGKKVLDQIAKVINGVADKDIRIEGHTDNIPIADKLKSKYASNWELSTARATAVARYLQDYAKVDAKRLVAAGYGEFRPISPNDTPEHRALNRRIELILIPKD